MKIPNTPFSTRLSGSAKETELRLRSIFQWKKKRPPVAIMVVVILGMFVCCSLVGFSSPDEANETVDILASRGVKPLATVEIPGGIAYVTGMLRQANLYWMPEGREPVLIRRNIPRVDLSSISLQYDGEGTLLLKYVQLDRKGLDGVTTIHYYIPKDGGAPEYSITSGGVAPS